MIKRDLVIIGGGSAGMAAAIEAKKNGIDDILILEKDGVLGGILNQCIHNGFGLTEFKEELTGPEYLSRFANQVKELGIEYKLDTLVLDVTENRIVTYSSVYPSCIRNSKIFFCLEFVLQTGIITHEHHFVGVQVCEYEVFLVWCKYCAG